MEMFLFCSRKVTTKESSVTTLEKCCSCSYFCSCYGQVIVIGHNTRKVLFLFLILVLVFFF
jgi:hypothetical protein